MRPYRSNDTFRVSRVCVFRCFSYTVRINSLHWGHFFESFGNVLGFIFFLPSLLFIRAHISDIKICVNHMLLNEFLSSPFSYRPADEMERKTPQPCVVLWVICVSPSAKPVWQASLLTFPVFIMAKLKPSPRVLLWQHLLLRSDLRVDLHFMLPFWMHKLPLILSSFKAK